VVPRFPYPLPHLPWRTRVFTRFSDRIKLPGGEVLHNQGVQYLELVWGKAVRDEIYVDTQVLAEASRMTAK
jgi:hypothetical protein